MNNVAVILGAGAGTRMKSEKSKLLLEIGGKTVIERTVAVFSELAEIDEIIVVCRESDLESFENVLADYDISYCFGGETRQESVINAVDTIDECDYILIHDGARPLVTPDDINKVVEKAYVDKLPSIYPHATLELFQGEGHGFTEAGNQRVAQMTLDFIEQYKK